MMTATLSRIKLFYYALEHLIGPLLVFVISYTHHVYFVDDFVSSFFAAFSLVSLLLVMAVDKTGILLALGLQLGFLGWVAIAEPLAFMEQLLFSASITLALVASYINSQEQAVGATVAPVATQPVKSQDLADQKDKLWQELYDARQEIKTLYDQKQELEATAEATIQAKITTELQQKDETILLLKHHLEAAVVEKQQFVEDRASCEEDIKKFASHMHEMALYQETLRQEILRLEEIREKEKAQKASETASKLVPEPQNDYSELEDQLAEYEEICDELRQKLEEETQTLDATRKELEAVQDELEAIKSAPEPVLEPVVDVEMQSKLSQSEEMCHKLNQQLEEKSTTLDATCKELVSIREELEALKNTPVTVPDYTAYEEKITQYEAECSQLKNQLAQEINAAQTARKELASTQTELEKAQALPKIDPEIEDKPSQYEAMYRQLKQQFEQKSKTLDDARKELFHCQDQLEILKKSQNEQLEPTAEEKHLMSELEAIQDKLDAQSRAHDEELVGYEEVIQGLLNQLHDKQLASNS